MSKICPKCGKQLADDAKFCMDCGCKIESDIIKQESKEFNFSTLIIILIVAAIVIGGIFILTSGGGNDNSQNQDEQTQDVVLTITDVSGWDSDSSSKTSYTLYTEAIFDKVPDNLKGYNVKTTYLDSKGSEIGHETEKLENVYYESSYSLSFGYYTTYTLPDASSVKVEIIKDGNVIENFTEDIDTSKIDFLN